MTPFRWRRLRFSAATCNRYGSGQSDGDREGAHGAKVSALQPATLKLYRRTARQLDVPGVSQASDWSRG
jgi:hypothetical protein